MANMGRCGTHGCAFSVRLVNGVREEYCPECALATAQAERDALRNKLNTDSQAFELECRKAQIESLTAALTEARRLLRRIDANEGWVPDTEWAALAAALAQEKDDE